MVTVEEDASRRFFIKRDGVPVRDAANRIETYNTRGMAELVAGKM